MDLVAQQNSGRPSRIACLLALAHRFDELVRSDTVKDYAELARLGHITRARVSQIMNLLNLAPEIQEYLLWLPSGCGREVKERDLARSAGGAASLVSPDSVVPAGTQKSCTLVPAARIA